MFRLIGELYLVTLGILVTFAPMIAMALVIKLVFF